MQKLVKMIYTSLGETIVDTMRVPFVSKQMNCCQGDGFSSVGSQTGTIKLTMAVTQDWCCQFPPLLGC